MNEQVSKNSVITLDYHVTDPDGEVVDEGREPLIYLHGGYDDIFPLIEESLQWRSLQSELSFGYNAQKPLNSRKNNRKILKIDILYTWKTFLIFLLGASS